MVTVVTMLQLNELPLVHWDSLLPGFVSPLKPFEHDATFDEHMAFRWVLNKPPKLATLR